MIKYGKNWAEKFSSVENQKLISNKSSTGLTVNGTNSRLSTGWALDKGKTGGVRFSENVRWCLTTRFEMGERTGKKANSEEIERQMRNARNGRNERLFQREEWPTKTQMMFCFFFFFSCLASRQRTRGQDVVSKEQEFEITADENDYIEAFIGDADRNNLLDDIQRRIGLEHPIVNDPYDLCAYHKEGKLQAFNVAMLKTILRHFEVPFRAKDRKTDLIRLLTEVIQECNC